MRFLRIGAYLLVVVIGGVGLARQEVIYRDDQARDCVAAWAGREDTRDMAEKTYRRNAETLTGLATNADPARIAHYHEQVERDVDEIRATLPNPSCDLDAARNRVGT